MLWFHSPEIKKLNLNEVYVLQYGWMELNQYLFDYIYTIDVTSYFELFMCHTSKNKAVSILQLSINDIIGNDTCYFLSYNPEIEIIPSFDKIKKEYICSISGVFLKHVTEETRMIKEIIM